MAHYPGSLAGAVTDSGLLHELPRTGILSPSDPEWMRSPLSANWLHCEQRKWLLQLPLSGT